ncbi:MAG: fasciclin [Bacteroidaceae bacterium]|nr:fasciclin [Bacteroidaceae bacterium]
MKLKNILAGVVLMTGTFGVQAQEYLNIGGQYFLLDEIDSVTIGASTRMLSNRIAANDRISIYNAALQATGLASLIDSNFYDANYDASSYPRYYYRSDVHNEVATVPDGKRKGYTLFVTPDSVLNVKYGIRNLRDLAVKAKSIYDQTYPADAGVYDDDYTHPKNPLNRYMRYTILTRDVRGWEYITIREIHNGEIQGALGIRTEKMNPIDWYQTLLDGTMIKFEQLTVSKWQGNGIMNQRYANRRYDDVHQIEGALISPTVEDEYIQDAPNGRYFYVDDIVAFTPDVRDKVQDMRIRMDFSTIFPELMTHDIRLNGDPMKNDNDAVADDAFKNGRNYYFPQGYLDGVTFRGNCKFVYRRPHVSYYVYCGDEMNVLGNYDIEFKLPPVPFAGTWQVRLGYTVANLRGVAQVYFDGEKQGEPIDLRLPLSHESIMGNDFYEASYDEMTKEEKAQNQKELREKGYYRGPAGAYYGSDKSGEFVTLPYVPRRVLCQLYIDNTKDHYLRIQCVSRSMTGNNNELMLDYIELVPKSVYDVPEGEMEDDL